MKPTEHKQEILDKRYMRMALIWAENSYCLLYTSDAADEL